MEEEPEDMSIGMGRSVSSVFSGFQWDRGYGYRQRSWWGKGQILSDTMLEGKLLLGGWKQET